MVVAEPRRNRELARAPMVDSLDQSFLAVSGSRVDGPVVLLRRIHSLSPLRALASQLRRRAATVDSPWVRSSASFFSEFRSSASTLVLLLHGDFFAVRHRQGVRERAYGTFDFLSFRLPSVVLGSQRMDICRRRMYCLPITGILLPHEIIVGASPPHLDPVERRSMGRPHLYILNLADVFPLLHVLLFVFGGGPAHILEELTCELHPVSGFF